MRATGSERVTPRVRTGSQTEADVADDATDAPRGRRRIGLLGGTFDPVHVAHLALARAALEHLALDELRFVPTGRSWQKKPAGASVRQRIEMLRLALAGLPRTMIDERETRRRGATYTIDTLLELRAESGSQPALILIMGSDQLRNLPTWHRWQELPEHAHLAVALRADDRLDGDSGSESESDKGGDRTPDEPLRPEIRELIRTRLRDTLPDEPHGSLVLFPMAASSVSGRELRQRLAEQADCRSWLPPDVLDYIERHHLYRSDAVEPSAPAGPARPADRSTGKRMDIGKLQRIVVDALDDNKAEDIRVFNTTGLTGLFDRIIIATGNSNRHTRALAGHVRERARRAGIEPISIEGEETGEWVLVDLGDAVVHVMQPAIREYYNLEEIWGARPVRMRIGPPPATPAARASACASRSSRSE